MTTDTWEKRVIEIMNLYGSMVAGQYSGRTYSMSDMNKPLEEMKQLIAEAQDGKDQAYRERNHLVAYLAHQYESHTKQHPSEDTDWEDDWRTIVCIHTPAGQMTWHIHDSEVGQFKFLDPAYCEWDGHTTEEKYARLAKLTMPNDATTLLPLDK